MKTRLVLFTLILWAGNLFAQNYLDVIRPFRGMSGKSGAESGIIPAAMVASNALLGNPALLSYTEKAFIAADLSFDQVQGTSVFNSTIRSNPQEQGISFNSLTYIFPVRVYRGAWVWGFNLQPVNSFTTTSKFSDFDSQSGDEFQYSYRFQETGNLYAYSIGSSFLVTMNTSLGFAVSYLSGKNSFSKVYEETNPYDLFNFDRYIDSLHFSPKYSGFAGRIGLLSELSETLNLGISLELPSRISVTESSSLDVIEWLENGEKLVLVDDSRSALEYAVWGPWRIGAGLGFTSDPLGASVNYRFHSYRTSFLTGNLLAADGRNLEVQVDEEINEHVQDVHEFSASMLWSMDPLMLTFAASLMNDPLNYRFDNIIRLDLGIGYQHSSGIGLTLAYRNEQWQSDLNHVLDSGVERAVEVENNFAKFQFGIKYVL
ncbi:hypothetical protein HQ531_00455 [bacterium]|nr:hypothetical protein [bacterium]